MAAEKRFVAVFEQIATSTFEKKKKERHRSNYRWRRKRRQNGSRKRQDLDRQENRHPVEPRSEGEERDLDERRARRLGAEAADSRFPRPIAWSPRLATASRSRGPIAAALAPPLPPASVSASRVDTPLHRKAAEGHGEQGDAYSPRSSPPRAIP